jgi:uncharacterized flavoprotein (TIGR03862 family)
MRYALKNFSRGKEDVWKVEFLSPDGTVTLLTRTVILALGGASWPETGSDGGWVKTLINKGVSVAPLTPANCGWEVDWPPGFLAEAEGKPLKNIVVRAGEASVAGELLITKYGLEGGAIYQLGRTLRAMEKPVITIDLKPAFSIAQLREKPLRAWKLSPAAAALLRLHPPPASLADATKSYPVRLLRPRPIAEAISTAGGVRWDELDGDLMLKRLPGVFCAGEMIDWDAPTGGYLLQGCFSTATRAATGVLGF